MSLTSSTTADNEASRVGGGFYLGQTFGGGFHAINSIIAGNSGAGGGPDVAGRYSDRGITASNGLNIFGSDVVGTTPGDRENVPVSVLFAGGLADNGGPTQTIALRDAIDNPALAGASLAEGPPADQRGEARPQPAGSLPDVGAVEIDQTFSTGVPLTGRVVGFSGYEYLASYPDLEAAFGLDAGAAANHYLTTGRFEGRTVLFDGLEYIASRADLVAAFGADDDAGARHYLEFGRAEGRTTTFDGLQYIASYDDLVAAFGVNRDAGSTHYIGHGASEERAPDAFDAAQYLTNYQDLRDAFGDDQEAATVHYIAHGYSEGRTDAALAAAADFLS